MESPDPVPHDSHLLTGNTRSYSIGRVEKPIRSQPTFYTGNGGRLGTGTRQCGTLRILRALPGDGPVLVARWAWKNGRTLHTGSAIPKACNEPVCWGRQIASPYPRVV